MSECQVLLKKEKRSNNLGIRNFQLQEDKIYERTLIGPATAHRSYQKCKHQTDS